MNIKRLVEQYIESKAGAWSPTTLRSERARLVFLTKSKDGLKLLSQPEELYKRLSVGMKPYAIKTTFIRVGELAEFAIAGGSLKGPNLIKQWYKANANKFKNVYESKPVGLSFEEAKAKIDQIADDSARQAAMSLLMSGLRAQELKTLDQNGTVVGKGGLKRTVSTGRDFRVEWDKHYTTLRYHLNKVGLNPHDLRKVCARTLVEHGATITDLMHFMGWRSPIMAIRYIDAFRNEKLGEGLKKRLEAADKLTKPAARTARKDGTTTTKKLAPGKV